MYCIPAGAFSGVRIGIHWSFPFVLVLHSMEAFRVVGGGAWWAGVVALTVVLLYVIILCHEFGHVFAARKEGIEAERVMLWPLGGLAMLGEEATGPAEVRIAAAGPAVNLAFAFLLLPVLAIFSIRVGLDLVNPFDHWWPELTSVGDPGFGHYLLTGVYKANIVVLLFNLFPAFPMDGGRMIRGLLYSRYGHFRSVIVTTTVSIVLCAGMLVVAIAASNVMLGFISVFVGVTAYLTRRRTLAMATEFEAEESWLGSSFTPGSASFQPSRKSREERREERERKQREQEDRQRKEVDEHVDRLLDKISSEGMESLTGKEREFLERASRMKR